MECLRCKNNTDGDICKVCGINKVIYSKVISISNKYYNEGLNYAKCDNMTLAIKNLEKSVLFDKSNFYARNLLGLCQFSIGQTSKAIINWKISIKTNGEKNRAAYYLNTYNKEDVQFSILGYNKAVKYVSKGNIDLAIIELNKAIKNIPTFTNAINLLACCHLNNGEEEQALKLIERVLEIDKGDEKSLFYISLLKESTTVKKTSEISKNGYNMKNNKNVFDDYLQESKKKSNKIIMISIATFLIGCLLTYTLFITSITAEKSINGELQLEVDKLTESEAVQKDKYEKRMEELNNELSELKERNREYEVVLESNSISKILTEVELLINLDKYKEAASLLTTIDTGIVKENHEEKFLELKSLVYSNAKSEYIVSGKNYFRSGDYVNAVADLEKAIIYNYQNEDVSTILYDIAISYENLGEYKKAFEYYNLIANKYENFEYINVVKEKIEQLN